LKEYVSDVEPVLEFLAQAAKRKQSRFSVDMTQCNARLKVDS
jgi:hypothetical protein